MSINADCELTTSIDKINDSELIILHNSNCDEKFFIAVCEYLKCTDLIFITNRDTEQVKCNRGILISLDLDYNIGNHTMIFAPLDNDRKGNSDLLTLSMYAAFNHRDFEVNGIHSGKVDIGDGDENYTVTYERFNCEEDIEPARNISMTTIAFCIYDVFSVKDIARCILDGILRYEYYLDNIHNNDDLLYRAHTNENIKDIADVFNCDKKQLASYNQLDEEVTSSPQVLVNPVVEKQKVLSKNTIMHGTVETPFYSKLENMLQ